MSSTNDAIDCEKIVLGENLGVRLLYCRDCDVVELKLDATSIRISPDGVQRIANLLMKASLKLNQLQQQLKSPSNIEQQVLH